nr:heme-binding protein [Agrobacterium tumefaciens]
MTSRKPTLAVADAREMIETSKSKATALNVPCSIAVIGPDGYLVSFERQDGAMSGSVELAINKAFTAQIFNNGTDRLGVLAQPGAELFGIQHSHNGRVVLFEGASRSNFRGRQSAQSALAAAPSQKTWPSRRLALEFRPTFSSPLAPRPKMVPKPNSLRPRNLIRFLKPHVRGLILIAKRTARFQLRLVGTGKARA